MDERNNLMVGRIIRAVISGLIVIFAIIIIFGSFIIVPAGTRGVVLTWGALNGVIFDPGLHFKMPISQQVVLMNVQTTKIESEKSESYSRDLQVVDIHSVVNYNIDPQAVGNVYQQYGLDFEGKVLTPNVEAAVKQTIAKYTAEDLLAKRSEVQSEIENTIKQAFPVSFVVTKYALVNEQFSDVFEKAIEAKQVAQQEAEKASNELKKAKIDAESRVAQAQGEAEAIKIQAEAITQQGGAAYVELKRIEKWNGQYPTTYMGAGATPLIQVK
jgi:prohibitin 2